MSLLSAAMGLDGSSDIGSTSDELYREGSDTCAVIDVTWPCSGEFPVSVEASGRLADMGGGPSDIGDECPGMAGESWLTFVACGLVGADELLCSLALAPKR